MGAQEIAYDEEHCYVYATVPASEGCENTPVLGFISHMDTGVPGIRCQCKAPCGGKL